MVTRTSILTPLGEFPSMSKAAQAHRVDRTTLVKRMESEPDKYKKIERVYAAKVGFVSGGVRWPCTWTQYRLQPENVKEQIYATWCQKMQQDPDLDSTAEAFFDDMDQQVEGELDTDDSELEEI